MWPLPQCPRRHTLEVHLRHSKDMWPLPQCPRRHTFEVHLHRIKDMWPTASVSQKTHLGGTLTSQEGHVAYCISVPEDTPWRYTHVAGRTCGYCLSVPEDTSWRYTHVAERICGYCLCPRRHILEVHSRRRKDMWLMPVSQKTHLKGTLTSQKGHVATN